MIAIAVLLRILANPLGNVFQKQLTAKGHHPFVVSFLTYGMLSLLCLFAAGDIRWRGFSLQFWMYASFAGLSGALGNGCLVKALQRGDLSVLGPINAYKSVIGMIIGVVLLGEIPNVWGVAGIALVVYGSYFVLETTEERFSIVLLTRKDIQYRLLALFLTALEAVLIKQVILLSSVEVAFLSWCWFGALFSLCLVFMSKAALTNRSRHISYSEARKYGYLVLCIGTMQSATSYIFDKMPVGYALSLFQLSVIVSVILGRQAFEEQAIGQKLIGSSIMVIGSIVIILMK